MKQIKAAIGKNHALSLALERAHNFKCTAERHDFF
jgi:hypothetical protein